MQKQMAMLMAQVAALDKKQAAAQASMTQSNTSSGSIARQSESAPTSRAAGIPWEDAALKKKLIEAAWAVFARRLYPSSQHVRQFHETRNIFNPPLTDQQWQRTFPKMNTYITSNVLKVVKKRIKAAVHQRINDLKILDGELGPGRTLSKPQCDKLTTEERDAILDIVNTVQWGPFMLSLTKLSKRIQRELLPTLEVSTTGYYKHTTILMEGYVVHNIKEYITQGAFPGEAGQGQKGGAAITAAAAQEMKFFKKRWFRAHKADKADSKKLEALATLIGIGPGEAGVGEDDVELPDIEQIGDDTIDPDNKSDSDDGSTHEAE